MRNREPRGVAAAAFAPALLRSSPTTKRRPRLRVPAASSFSAAAIMAAIIPFASQEPRPQMKSPSSREPKKGGTVSIWVESVTTGSPHMDTVPPFFGSREDGDFIWGRGSCDAKGIIAAMIAAAEKLLNAGTRNIGLLFVVGEERNSAGARAAAATPRGSRFLINGEPTENRLALGSKGALRYEITTHGKLAHSAYPELGHSAIHTLLDVLSDIRQIPLPEDALLGRSTLNVGTIEGGRAANVVADHAEAEIMFRTVGDPATLREAVSAATAGRAEAREVLHTPAVQLSN